MRQVNVHEARTGLSRLLELVESGERVVIARAGHPVAILSSCAEATRRRRLGLFRGQGSVPTDFDELPEDVAKTFGGEQA